MTFISLDHPIRWIFLTHALAGAIALFIMIVPLWSAKGGKLHVRTGWVYVAAMVFVSISALAITPWRALSDLARDSASIRFAVFLAYVALFTLNSIAFGLFTLREKKRRDPSRSPRNIIPPVSILILGVLTQVYGFLQNDYLLMFFPFLGHGSAVTHLRYWLSVPQLKMHWWYAHMNGMFTACIATITAFLVTALPRFAPELDSPVLWIAPGLILGTVLNRWTLRYKKQFEKPARVEPAV